MQQKFRFKADWTGTLAPNRPPKALGVFGPHERLGCPAVPRPCRSHRGESVYHPADDVQEDRPAPGSVRRKYADRLAAEGVVSSADADALIDAYRVALDRVRACVEQTALTEYRRMFAADFNRFMGTH